MDAPWGAGNAGYLVVPEKAFCAVEIGNCSHCGEMILQDWWVSLSESLQNRTDTRIRDYAVTRRIIDVGVRGAHPNLP